MIALYGRRLPEESLPYVEEMLNVLSRGGEALCLYRGLQDRANDQWNTGWNFPTFKTPAELQAQNPTLVLCLGGDGTMLDASTLVGRSGIPLLGINVGRLGFLASVPRAEAADTLEAVLRGEYTVEERNLIQAETRGGGLTLDPNFALNELAVSRKGTTSMISVHVHLNDAFLNTYWADGLVIATPTGSTGYNLSCGGPILIPGSDNFIITPIAPHNLTVRPIVIPNTDTITLRIEAREESYLASLDSRVYSLDVSTEIILRRADFKLRLVRTLTNDFATTLRNKLLWGLDRRN
jgi:NAD+ kinase